MEILHLGHSSFKIMAKNLTVVTDPFDPKKVGIELPKTEADVVTVSHHHFDHDFTQGIRGDFICFDSPGEYEINNAEIIGINSFHDTAGGSERGQNTIFYFELDGLALIHLGDLGTELSSEQIEKIGQTDILFIPVGGKYTIDPKMAAKVISELEPKIIIPMHYRVGSMTDLEPLDNFLKEIGKEPKVLERLKIQKKDIPESPEVIVLKF